MDFGTAIHRALEVYKHPKKNIDLKYCKIIFKKKFLKLYFEHNLNYEDPISPSDVMKFIMSGFVILNNLHNCKEFEDSKVMFVEQELYEDIERLDDIKIKFKGFVDVGLVKKTKRKKTVLYICDYKTASWGWGQDKKRDELLKAQLRLYKHFVAKKYGLSYDSVRTAFIILKKKPNNPKLSAEWWEFSSGEKTTLRAVSDMQKAITIMNSGKYQKNLNNCIDKYGKKCVYLGTPHCKKDY